MASSTSSVICTAQTSFKKKPGLLTLTKRSLSWTCSTSSTSNPDLSILTTQMSALFASKEGGPRVMLKIAFTPLPNSTSTDDSFNFTFTNAATALSDREKLKAELSGMIAANREREATAATTGGGGQTNGTAVGGDGKGKGKEKALDQNTSGGGGGASTTNFSNPSTSSSSTNASSSQASIFRLRKLVLQSSPSLLALHRDLVLTSQITESEFWEGRQDLVSSFAAEEQLMKGKSGEMVDPKTVTGQNGTVTVKITPALIREIFEEFPVVLKAYNDNVPEPLDEAQFWTRYFQSKLFNRNRTTNRAAVDSIKDDSIFDKYLGQEDDDIEPQHQSSHEIYRLLDLSATEQDQHEITNLPRDFTMKAGGQRASLPLMRRFNEHSERLLSQALGAQPDRPRTYVDPGNAGDRRYYSEIELSDLSSLKLPDRISLSLNESNHSTLTGASGIPDDEGDEGKGEGDGEEGLMEMAMRKQEERRVRQVIIEDWEGRLEDFEVDSKAMKQGMRDMFENISNQHERTRKTGGSSGLPRAHLLTVESISTTTLEFLRHFWSAILPAKPNDTSAFASASPKERAERAKKFKEYLEKSRERVGKALIDAKGDGEELGKRVEAALQPISDAINAAVEMYKTRLG